MTVAASAFDPVDFLERAVATPSHESVEAMRALLVETLEAHGVEPTVDAAGNVLAERGDDSPRVVLNTHLDTVSPHVDADRDGEVVTGRGACDAKGPLAAMLDAFLRADPPGEVGLAITPDEETDSTGAAALDVEADAVIVGEPTGLDVCHAAKGRFVATVTLGGENAHAAEASEGVNAVAAAGPVLEAVGRFDAAAGPEPHPVLGSPLLTPTVIAGGGATNQVPDSCVVTLDRRSVPPETAEGFRAALAAHLEGAAPPDVEVSVALIDRPSPWLEAWVTPADEPLVEALRAASGGAVRPFTAATEAAYFADVAPTVVFGPGELVDDDGPVAHADREYVRLDEVAAAAEALVGTIGSFGA